MAFSNQVYGIISQVGERIYERQSKKREKANTWVVGIGTIIAALLAGIGFLLEANVDWAPDWLAGAAAVLTMVGTLFGVSRTKNGVTHSTLDQINDEVSRMIDERPGDSGATGVPEPVAPTTAPETPTSGASETRGTGEIADELDTLAKRLAGREG